MHQPLRPSILRPISVKSESLRQNPSVRSKNAIEMPWSNGQAEGQINRLKTLKRAMYGRTGPELLRARMLPFRHTD